MCANLVARMAILKVTGRICYFRKSYSSARLTYSYQKRHRQGINSRNGRNINHTTPHRPDRSTAHEYRVEQVGVYCSGHKVVKREKSVVWALPEGRVLHDMSHSILACHALFDHSTDKRTNKQKASGSDDAFIEEINWRLQWLTTHISCGAEFALYGKIR